MLHIWDKTFCKNADALMANGILHFAVYVAFFFFTAKCQTMQYNREYHDRLSQIQEKGNGHQKVAKNI